MKLVFTTKAIAEIEQFFETAAPREQGVFCLIKEAAPGRVVVTEIIYPGPDSWSSRQESLLVPTTGWISVVLGMAQANKAGIAFLHSHPNALHPGGLSAIDRKSFTKLSQGLADFLNQPMVAAVLHADQWTGEYWDGSGLQPLDGIVAIGRTLKLLHAPKMTYSEIDSRQISALGKIHDQLRTMTVAVIGVGGLGSPVAEQLARMGIGRLILVDNDVIDSPSNLRRIFGTTMADYDEQNPLSKVDVVGTYLKGLGLGTEVTVIVGDIRDQAVMDEVTTADVIMGCTDTHSSRAALNSVPYECGIPVIDTGVRVASRTGDILTGLWAEIRVITPETPCLVCRGVVNFDLVRAENLPAHERAKLVKEGYTPGNQSQPEPSVTALTVMAAGHATSSLLTLLSEDGVQSPSGYRVDSFMAESFALEPEQPKLNCLCRRALFMA